MRKLLISLCLFVCVVAIAEEDNKVKSGFYIARRTCLAGVDVPDEPWAPVYVTSCGNVYEFVPDNYMVYQPQKLRDYQRLSDKPMKFHRNALNYVVMPDTDGVYEAHVRVELPDGRRLLVAELVLVLGTKAYRVGGCELDPIDVTSWGDNVKDLYEVDPAQ